MNTAVMKLAQSGTVQANGQELYYELHGEGPPLVLVMGIGYDSSLWTLAQVPVLSTQFQVILVDNRDAGRSSKAIQPYTIADMADDLAGLLDALGIQRSHLLGLSMGGMIAQEFALRHSDRLDRLVLAGTGAAPARSAVDPIQIWSWVKTNDPTGEVFGGQQFVSLFSRSVPPEPRGRARDRRTAGQQPAPDESRGIPAEAGRCLPAVRCARQAGRNHSSDSGRRGRTGSADATLGSA